MCMTVRDRCVLSPARCVLGEGGDHSIIVVGKKARATTRIGILGPGCQCELEIYHDHDIVPHVLGTHL
jgi:hypothetical protein